MRRCIGDVVVGLTGKAVGEESPDTRAWRSPVRGLMYCLKGGSELPEDAAFCLTCGRAQDPPTAASQGPIVAPPLPPVEATNIFRLRMRRAPPDPRDRALSLLDQFLAFSVELRNPLGLHQAALTLAVAHQLSAAYDADYVALTHALACNLWPVDRRLPRELHGWLCFVRGIIAYVARTGWDESANWLMTAGA